MQTRVLDATAKQAVQYAVPLWLRDEQIRLNISRVSGRIQPQHDPMNEPAAIVCFGPSLQQTWEQVKDFKYVFSCSGSHKFLIERGIIPTYHVEVDPRAHKIKLIGEPHPDVEYLIASACHPDVYAHLRGFNVKMWHVFDATDDGKRLLPPGEWAITGGCDVGLRALTLAGFLGFRDLHVFGMDQSAGTVEGPLARHAAEHPNSGKKFALCEFEGVTYRTTPAMLEAARTVWHELDMMPKIHATFYGEGLCQHMAQHYVPKPLADNQQPFVNIIAVEKPELISAEYRDLNTRLHSENLAYGVGGGKHADTVLKLISIVAKNQSQPVSVLDYGAGKGYLQKALPFPIFEYDPAIPGKQDSPRPADIVICTDVLEHIERDRLIYVLDDIRRCLKQIGFLTIHTGAAQKTLPDGRNTHLIQKDIKWWRTKLEKFFQIGKIFQKGMELYVVISPKPKIKKAVSAVRETQAV